MVPVLFVAPRDIAEKPDGIPALRVLIVKTSKQPRTMVTYAM